jgi:hypothetical protein
MRRFVVLPLLALLSAAPALAQEDTAGSVRSGTIPIGPIHMGTNQIDGSNIVFTGGSLTGLSSLGATGSSALTGGGTLSGTFAGAHTLSGAVTFSAAGTALSVTNNGTFGGTLTTGTNSTNGLLLSGTTLSVTGTGNGNGTIKALGTGSLNFQTGATPFTGLQLIDPGANAVNFIRIQGHPTGQGADIFALGDSAAVLNLKAGASGTGGLLHVWTPTQMSLLSQHNNVVLSGSNLADLASVGILQVSNISGNNGANTNTNGFNQYLLTDTAQVNGSLGLSTYSQTYAAGANGDRNMMDEIFAKSGTSVDGGHIFELHRFFMNISSDEKGTGATITGSIAGNVLTVTDASSNVIQAQTMISGPGVVPTRVTTILSGSGGVGTYSLDFSQDVSSESMVAGNYKGSAELMNPDLTCNGGSWWSGCQLAEWDLRARAGDVQYKDGLTLNYAAFDSGHGVWSDTAIQIAAGDFPAGVGKGRVMLSIGSTTHAWPINILDSNSAIIRAQHNIARVGANAAQYKATFGVDFTIVECGIACWRSPGFTVDGAGQLSAGPLTTTYNSTGAVISASRVTTTSASVVSGGGGFLLHDEVLEPQTGSLWDVGSISAGGVVTSLSLTKAGFASSCPAGTIRFTSLGSGAALTGTVSCATSNGVTLGASTDKIGLYGVTPISKPTLTGACSGNSGCQAIRDFLVSRGDINSSITD